MKMRSYKLPAVLLAVITAIGMILAAGMFSQAYAADNDYYIEINSRNGDYVALPGRSITLWASVYQDFEDGAEILDNEDIDLRWELGNDDSDFARIRIYKDEPGMAVVQFHELKPGQTEIEGMVRATVTASVDGKDVASDTVYLSVDNDFYQLYPNYQLADLNIGETQNDIYAQVVHYTVDGPEDGTPVKNVEFTWEYDPEGALEINTTEKSEDLAVYSIKRVSSELTFVTLKAEWKTEEGEELSDYGFFWFRDIPRDMNEYKVVLPIEYSDFGGWTSFVDDDFVIKRSELEQDVVVHEDNLLLESGKDYDLMIYKYTGYNEETGEPLWVEYSGDLKVDPKGSEPDINGEPTEGTAAYMITARAKEGSIFTGETNDFSQYIFMNSNRCIGGYVPDIEFSRSYVKYLDDEPYYRYEVKPGTVLEPTVKLNDELLAEGIDYESVYDGFAVIDGEVEPYTSPEFPLYPGEYTFHAEGIGEYYGTSYSVNIKAGYSNENFKASAKTLKVKLAKKKTKTTKKVTFAKSKAFKVSRNLGTVTFQKVSGNSKITVSSAGKVTVKKGLKKGTYTVKVKVTDADTDLYFGAEKTVSLKVKVTK